MPFWKLTNTYAHLKGGLLVFLLVSLLAGSANFALVSAQSVAPCPVGAKCIYTPMIMSPAIGDLQINGVEVTQAVQDLNNSVPLVAGRSTMLRIYARTVGGNQPMSNVKVSVSASTATSLLNGSPTAYSATVPLINDRNSLSSTINITLPPNWTSGTIDLTVRLDPDNLIAEQDETNNSLTRRFVFNQVPALSVKIVPIRYVNTNDQRTYPAPTRDSISDWILRTYPVPQVNVVWREPYTFTGNLSTAADFSRLLQEVTALKSTDSAPRAQVYYALVPTTDGSRTWFYAGIAGIGWVGSRTAVGLDIMGSAGQIAAHEIGHNLGMLHTPCGDPASTDPNYPYPTGIIGQLGTDVFSGTLYAPSTKDVMSYCTPKWISDYTYKVLYAAQQQSTAMTYSTLSAPVAERGLLLRALITDDRVDLQPAYVVPGPIDAALEAGDYQLEVLGANGQVMVAAPVRAYKAEIDVEGETPIYGINTVIPLPDQPAAGFRLVKEGRVLAEQALRSDVNPAPMINSTSSMQGAHLQWSAGGQPALVRYSRDGGETWTTTGLDVTGGELLLQPALREDGVLFQVIPAGTWQ